MHLSPRLEQRPLLGVQSAHRPHHSSGSRATHHSVPVLLQSGSRMKARPIMPKKRQDTAAAGVGGAGVSVGALLSVCKGGRQGLVVGLRGAGSAGACKGQVRQNTPRAGMCKHGCGRRVHEERQLHTCVCARPAAGMEGVHTLCARMHARMHAQTPFSSSRSATTPPTDDGHGQSDDVGAEELAPARCRRRAEAKGWLVPRAGPEHGVRTRRHRSACCRA